MSKYLPSIALSMACNLLLVAQAQAQSAPPDADTSKAPAAPQTAAPPVTELDAVSVSATRGSKSIKDVPGTVSVINSDEAEKLGAKDVRDLVRYEPGVNFSNNPQRAGLGSFSIRGINGNRVLLTVDGSRIPDFPANGQPGTYTRDYIDPATLKQVEIVRGPGSSLYGSDAIGGVVAYRTKDPSDYLNIVGKNWYTGTTFLYDSSNDSYNETGVAAARYGIFDILGLYTRRDGEEFAVRKADSNPQSFSQNTGLFKIVAHPSDIDLFRFTGEVSSRRVGTDNKSELGPSAPGSPTIIRDSENDDQTRRYRLGLEQEHTGAIGFIDKLSWRINYQNAYRQEDNDQLRTPPGSVRLRVTDRQFEQDLYTADVQLDSQFLPFSIPNNFTYGLDFYLSHTRRYSDRTEFNLTTGTSTKTTSGETFPNRTFPITDTYQIGGYVQDRIELLNQHLEVTPGVRVDYYSLNPHPDDTFRINNPESVGAVDEVAVSPKVGVLVRLNEPHALFANYARGFRSPPYDDANIGFTNQALGYRVLPNTSLKPETSDGFEIGFRGRYKNGSSFSVAEFYNIYHDFIQQSQVGVGAAGFPANFIDFQSRNLNRVVIYGTEARGELKLPYNISALGSIAYQRGEDEKTRQPIDSVDPLKIVSGLRYTDPQDWGGEVLFTWVDRKSRVSTPATAGQQPFFAPDSYETVDISAFYNYGTLLSFNAGIRNLFNEHYFVAQDVIQVNRDNALLPIYAQAGRTFFVSATVRW